MLKIIEKYSYLRIQNQQSVHHVHFSLLPMICTQDSLSCLSWHHILYVLKIHVLPLLRLQLLYNNNNNNSIYLNTIKNSAKADVVVYGQ